MPSLIFARHFARYGKTVAATVTPSSMGVTWSATAWHLVWSGWQSLHSSASTSWHYQLNLSSHCGRRGWLYAPWTGLTLREPGYGACSLRQLGASPECSCLMRCADERALSCRQNWCWSRCAVKWSLTTPAPDWSDSRHWVSAAR